MNSSQTNELSVRTTGVRRISRSKRLFDIVFSLVGLILLFPVMLFIALCVRLDSKGTAFFSQKRLGYRGEYFNIHKYRKFPDTWGTKGPGVTLENDVRMTRVGRFLERTKLDELPQLWNILKGEMSFVGPRPESTRYGHLFTKEFQEVLDYVPGIFGPNQFAFRNESAMYPEDQDPEKHYEKVLFPTKAANDIEYFRRATFFSDLWWIITGAMGTIWGVINWKRFINRYFYVMLMDLAILELSWLIAHVFRFGGLQIASRNEDVYFTGTWFIPLIVLPLMLIFGCYRHPIKFFSFNDLMRLLGVTSAAWAIAMLLQIGFLHRNTSIGISILALVLFLVGMLAPRVWRADTWKKTLPAEGQKPFRESLIYGANEQGNALAKFFEKGMREVRLVGFLDSDPEMTGRFVNGYKILGTLRDIDLVHTRFPVRELWLTENLDPSEELEIEAWGADKGVKIIALSDL